MRCSACGAWNVAEAAWCTQCYRRFEDPSEPEPAPAEVTAPTADATTGQRPAPADPPRPTAGDPVGDRRDVRMRDGQVEWRCGTCEGWAPLEVDTCPACGSSRRGFGPATDPAPVSTDAPILVASALLPGLGHLLARRTGSGIARLGLTLLWLVGGVAILLTDAGAVARLPGLVLLLGVLVLWLGSVLDAAELQRGGSRELLNGRALLWLVVGVTGGLMIALFVATASGVQSPGPAV